MNPTSPPFVPKLTKYPRLRTHVRKGRDGRVYVYHFYDMRGEGVPDIPLGKDRQEALAKWDEIHNKKPRIKGRLEEAFHRWEQEKLPEYDNAETRRGYAKGMKWLRKVFAESTWDAVELRHLVEYLRARKGKTQANREMALLSLVWHQAQMWGMTSKPYPASGLKRAKWKNPEKAREFVVTARLFEAVYAEACQFIKDTMDLATATGMRLQDCIKVVLPADNILHLKAGKTRKKSDFDLSLSEVLPSLIERRRGYDASHLMLISTPDGFPVFAKDLRREWDKARQKAAEKARKEGQEAFATEIEAMYLRDMRKMAADLAEDLESASKLLQHSNPALTLAHYRSKAEKVKPVR
jgi:hypothetical protein